MGSAVPRKRNDEDEAAIKRKRRRRSGVITVELPEDLMIEILLRLPVKSLIRFECVCKSWRDLFISPKFIAMYNGNVSRQRTKVSIYCYGDTRKRSGTIMNTNIFFRLYDFILTKTVDLYGKNVKIVGCSSGVVCLSLCSSLDVFALWNPGTSLFKRFSFLKVETFPSLFEFGDVSCGFYFDLLDYSFKIVRVGFCSRRKMNTEEGTSVHAFVYNSIDKSWRKKQLLVPAYRLRGCDSFKSDVICVKRCMYWLIKVLPRGRYLDDKYILCFDMVKETFYRIELPPCGFAHRMQLTSYVDSLAMFVRRTTRFNFPGYTFDVWVMKEDYGGTNHSWSKQFSCTPSVHAPFAEGFMIKDDICWVVLSTYGFNYYLCNSESGLTIEFNTRGDRPENIFLYRQSLASF